MFVVVLGLKSRSDADAVAAVRAWFECVLIACELEMLTRQCLAESELLWLCVLVLEQQRCRVGHSAVCSALIVLVTGNLEGIL